MSYNSTPSTRSRLPVKIAVSCGQYFVAMITGVLLYFMALVLSGQDYSGFENLVCQPFIAVGFTLLFEVVAILLGIPLVLLQPRSRVLRSHLLYVAMISVGLILFIAAIAYELISTQANMNIAAILFLCGYFLVLFSIVNWPLFVRGKPKSEVVVIDE